MNHVHVHPSKRYVDYTRIARDHLVLLLQPVFSSSSMPSQMGLQNPFQPFLEVNLSRLKLQALSYKLFQAFVLYRDRILPRHGAFYLELIYKLPVIQSDVNPDKVLGIDPGLNNWLTCVSNIGTNFIVDGLQLKSLNQWYNKRVSVLKENQPQGFWSQQLANITEKRNRQVRDAVNKAARIVLNHLPRKPAS